MKVKYKSFPENHSQRLTSEEKELIVKLKAQHFYDIEIAKTLKRTVTSIRSFTHYYGFPNSKWSEEENELLRREYNNLPAKVLAKKLNRTIRSIYIQAHKLNLHKNSFKKV